MRPTLVTGATGFLGWHVARLLRESGVPVRALVRGGRPVRELDVEVVEGDLRDATSLARACAGCEAVFHVAADYRLWARDQAEMYASNVDGTRLLLQAAQHERVDRVVYTSTVGCVKIPASGIGTESDSPSHETELHGPYKRSKFLAEQVALEFAAQGFPVVIVNPTAPIGDHDWKPTPTGKIVVDYLKGAIPAFIDTGLNVIDAEDCARGHLLALAKGRSGERYLLGSENLTLEQILGQLASIVGRKPPTTKMPYFVALLAGFVSTTISALTQTEPQVPLDGVRMAKVKMWVDCGKARRELGFDPAPARVAFEKAVSWFQRNGYA